MSYKNIDLDSAVKTQLPNHSLVMTNLHAFGWKAANFDEFKNTIIPVMIIPSDFVQKVESVQQGIFNFISLLSKIREWMRNEANLEFVFSDPLLKLSSKSSGEWILNSNSSTDERFRFKYYWDAVNEIHSKFPKRTDICFVGGVYIGSRPDVTKGAGDAPGVDNPPIFPPSTLAFDYDVDYKFMGPQQKQMLWAAAHELGHQFGLDHPDKNSPLWGWSVMSNAELPYAKIKEPELSLLKKSPFIKEVSW